MLSERFTSAQARERLAGFLAAPPPSARIALEARQVVLYGAGEMGAMMLDLLPPAGIEVIGLVDRRAEEIGPRFRGRPVHTPANVPSTWRDELPILVCMVKTPWQPMRQQLRAQGWRRVQHALDFAADNGVPAALDNGWASTLDEPCANAIWHVFEQLADPCSRAHYAQMVAWRVARQEWAFDDAPVNTEDRYFPADVIPAPRNDERWLDGGAHHGGATRSFLAWCRQQFDRVLAFEPDPEHVAAWQRWCAGVPPELAARIALRECGLGETTGRALLRAGRGYASCIGEGPLEVELQCLDDVHDFAASFVKLHLEGSEGPALRGGLGYLARHRPIVAVTCYHRPDGLHQLQSLLIEGLPDYRFHFRNHGWCGNSAVFYAVPKHRAAR